MTEMTQRGLTPDCELQLGKVRPQSITFANLTSSRGKPLSLLARFGSTLERLILDIRSAQAADRDVLRMSGTSMATPIVSGCGGADVAAKLALTPDQVKARLMKTAWKGVGQYTSFARQPGQPLQQRV